MFQHGKINTPAYAALGFLVVQLRYQVCIAAIRLKCAVNRLYFTTVYSSCSWGAWNYVS